jgi:uncharacterized protein (AIM24 family)
LSFSIAAPATGSRSRPPGNWRAVELAHDPALRPAPLPAVPSASAALRAPSLAHAAPSTAREAEPVVTAPPPRAVDFARSIVLIHLKTPRVARLHDGTVLVGVERAFHVRLDLLRVVESHTDEVATTPLKRKRRGRLTEEWLGSTTRPVFSVEGASRLVLCAPSGSEITPVELVDEVLYLREDHVGGFDDGLAYECGRLAVGDGEAVAMVQLQGQGFVVLESPTALASVETFPQSHALVQRDTVVGWVGRLVPRSLTASEAPGGARGWVAFSGEGLVIVDVSRRR